MSSHVALIVGTSKIYGRQILLGILNDRRIRAPWTIFASKCGQNFGIRAVQFIGVSVWWICLRGASSAIPLRSSTPPSLRATPLQGDSIHGHAAFNPRWRGGGVYRASQPNGVVLARVRKGTRPCRPRLLDFRRQPIEADQIVFKRDLGISTLFGNQANRTGPATFLNGPHHT